MVVSLESNAKDGASFPVDNEPHLFGIGGVIVPMFTPVIHENGGFGIDIARDERLVSDIVGQGADVLFILGNAGRFQKLTQTQRKEHIDIVMKTMVKSDRKIPILVGVSSYNLQESCELAEYSERKGVSGVVYMPAFGDGDPIKKTEAVLNHILKMPFIFYSNPDAHIDKRPLPVQVITPFVNDPRVIGIKNSTHDFETYKLMMRMLDSEKFHVFEGYAPHIVEAVRRARNGEMKFHGGVPVQANLDTRIIRGFLDGSVGEASMQTFMEQYLHTPAVLDAMIQDGRLDPATRDMFA